MSTEREIHTKLISPQDSTRRFYSASFVREYGSLEIIRAYKYNKPFSFINIEIDEFGLIKKKFSKNTMLELIKDTVKLIMTVTRGCDILGMINKKEFILLLPETDYFGALITARRLRKTLNNIPEEGRFRFLLTAVSYPHDGRNFDEMLENARLRLEDYRNSLIFSIGLENKDFWDCIYTLLEEGWKSPGEHHFILEDAKKKGEWNSLLQVSSIFIHRLQEVVLKEILRTPNARGILYISFAEDGIEPSFFKELTRVKDLKTKIFILGEGKEWDEKSDIHYLNINDERLLYVPFTLFFRRDFAYGVFCKKEDNRMTGFHTMDSFLVEGIIGKLQENYLLQKQL